jgi:activator of 2-hydroxyglutaryl-CoA dehydratase
MAYNMGIDVGSTTVKVVVFNEQDELIFKDYRRHKAKVRETLVTVLESIKARFTGKTFKVALTGSAGMGIAEAANFAFAQEVFATASAVRKYMPTTDVVIELGGEDAKIIFFGNSMEQRMNGSCAGGTGAFIDQIASLMDTRTEDMDALAEGHTRIYPIAARCGVFAKTDVQPLLNQGTSKSDIAASVFQAIVNQTIAGLAQGRKI